MVSFISSERWRMTDSPSDFPLPRTRRSALSPAARALRLQRIFARLQDGAAYADIAAEEGFSRERPRQIIRAATAPGRGHDGPDHKRMQIARLTPALRPRRGRGRSGRRKVHPALVEGYRPTRPLFRSAPGFQLIFSVDGSATSAILEARQSRQDETRFCRRRPRAIRRGASQLPPCQLAS
jgi:hypothetical protein